MEIKDLFERFKIRKTLIRFWTKDQETFDECQYGYVKEVLTNGGKMIGFLYHETDPYGEEGNSFVHIDNLYDFTWYEDDQENDDYLSM